MKASLTTKRMPSPSALRDSAIVRLWGVKARQWIPRIRARVREVLRAHTMESARRTARRLPPLPLDYRTRWKDALKRVLRPHILQIGIDGYRIGDVLVGKKSFGDYMLWTKGIEDSLAAGMEDGFVLVGLEQPVDSWLETVASSGTRTQAKRISKIHNDAATFWDPEKKRGLTPRQVSKQLLHEGLAKDRNHANMIAQTNATWAYNEGAMLSYAQNGVTVLEWMTSKDDAVCEMCAGMDGARVQTGQPFWPAGSRMEVEKVPVAMAPPRPSLPPRPPRGFADVEKGTEYLKETYPEWWGNLSEDQRRSVGQYQSWFYNDVNGDLRTLPRMRWGDRTKEVVGNMDKVFTVKTKEDLMVYRGFADPDLADKLRKGIICPGDVYADKAFLSTTLAQERTLTFHGIGVRARGAENTFIAKITVRKGTRFLPMTNNPESGFAMDEAEMLFKRGSKMRIVSIDQTSGVNILNMEMI